MPKGKIKKSEKVKRVITGKPHVRIGKNGVTPGVIREIHTRLKHEGVIKVKVMKSLKRAGADIKEIAHEVASKVNADVIDIRGNVFVIAKSKLNMKLHERG